MRSKRKCRHIPTGKVYGSVREMCDDLGISFNVGYKILAGRTVDRIGIEYEGESLVGLDVKEQRCKICGIVKPKNQFGVDKRTGSVRGYSCKKCRANRENARRKVLGKEEMKLRRIKSVYNISYEEAKALCAIPNCEICGVEFVENKRNVNDYRNRAIDHCHGTKKVRGVICFGCNLALGHARDNKDILKSMIEYLERNN